MTRPPKTEVELTPCEARTRSGRPLVELFFPLLPQEMELRLAHNPIPRTRTLLFKQRAPNDMKKEDLLVKWWIITEPILMRLADESEMTGNFLGASKSGSRRCTNRS
jgi:hypothetical protein